VNNISIVQKYFPEITIDQKHKFEQLQVLYELWNAQINVVSRADIDNLYEKHVLHSLGIAKVCQFISGTHVLDVGTGGGFPGIPLAILFPEVQFHLVDSIGKKIKVVNEVSQALGLKNLTSEHHRAENVEGSFDFIVSRAVTRMEPFISWIDTKIKAKNINQLPNGILYLKGGDLTEEMAEIKRKYTIYNLPDYFEEEFFETKKVVYVPL
jgi:16S rRNA (guanine527-N7)-methyltransferase